MNRRACLASLSVLALAACTTPQALRPRTEAEGRSLSRTGRFSLRYQPPAQAAEVVQGGFAWLDHDGRLQLDLTSPVGAVMARIEVAANGLTTLTEADGAQTIAASPDALAERILGAPLPVVNLRDWLAGELSANPEAYVEQRNERGQPVQFQQAGWRVRVEDADAQGPLRMQLNHTTADGTDIQVRLVLRAVAPAPSS